MGLFSFLSKEKKEDLDKGLEKTKSGLFSRISKAVAGKSKVDDEVLDNLEEILVTSDVGVETTVKIVERIQKRVARDKYLGTAELNTILKEEIAALLLENTIEDQKGFDFPLPAKPYVIMVVGVNGVGKTTTIGKLAYHFKKAGKSVLLGAADTFRAAAIDQLRLWASRVEVDIVAHQPGADPGAVVFDTLQAAQNRKADVVIIDTAGRLQTKHNLMDELKKIRKVAAKYEAAQEVLLVLDATTGQNGLSQARSFMLATEVTGIFLSKLDGTARGGIVLAICDELQIPIKYIGTGEKRDDIAPFDPQAFVKAIFE